MRFGNTAEQLWRWMLVGLAGGCVFYVVSVALFVFSEGLLLERLIPPTFMIVVPLVIGVVIAPTLMFSIHFVGDWVEHRLLDRWVLSRARASDFISMKRPSGLFAARIMFGDGTEMRFLGADLRILASLETELHRRIASPDVDRSA